MVAHLADEVRVGGVDPGVEHGDGGAGSVVARVPGLRSTDLRDALGQVGLHLGVEVDLRDVGVERSSRAVRRGSA